MPNTTPSAAPRRGLIARLISRVLAPRPAPCEPSRLRRARFEALESRVLLSATPTLVGTPLDDNDSLPTQPAIYGTLGDDIIDGLAGDDLIFADGDGRFGTGGGRDIVTGGAGRDVIDGEAGNDWLEPAGMAAGPGIQKVYGGAGTDTLFLRGFPSDYRVFAYVDPETAIQGLLFEATTGDAIENRVGVFEMESIAFGAAVLDVADGSAAPQVTLSASGPFAVDDLVTATRGATRVVVDVAALYANDLNVGATPVLGGVSFTSADLTLDFATDAAGVTALGLDPAGYPLGAIVADLTAPLTRDRSFQYYFLDANGEFPPPATVTLRAELGQRFYFSGETASFGRELWLYDPASSLAGTGEPFATAIDEADTLAGGAGGNPQDITSLGNTVFWRGDSDVAGVVASRWHAYSPNLGYVALDAVADLLGFDSGATSPVLGLRSGDLFWGATGGALQAWREDGTAGASVTLAGNERRLLSDAGGVPAYAARDLDSGAEQLFAVLGAPAGSGIGLVQLTAGGDSGNRIDEIVALPVRTLAETTRTFYFTGVFGGESGLFAVTTLWDASAGTWSSLLAPRLLTGGADAEVVADAPSALTIARTGDAFSGLPEGLFFFGTDPGAGGQLYALADNAFGDTQVLVTGYLGAAFDGLEIRPWDNGVIFSGIAQFAASPDPFVATWTDADEDGQYDVALAFQAGSGTIEHLTVDGAGNAAFVFDGGGFDTLYLYRPDQLRTYAVVSGTGEIDEVRFAGGHLVYRMTEFGGGTDFYLFDHALATETGIQVRSDEFSGSVPGSGFVNDYRNVAIPGALVFDAARSDGGAPRALFVVNGANDVSFPAGGVLAESEGAVLDGAWVGTGLRVDTADLGLFRIAADGTATTLYAASTNFSSEAEVLGRKVLFGTNSASVNDILVYDAATGTTTALLPSHLLGAAETVGSRIVFSALDFSRAVNADTDTANNRWTLYSYDGSAVTALLDLPTGGGGGQHVYEWGSAGDFLGDDSRLYWKQANDTTGVEVHSIDLTAADPGATLSILDIAADDISGADYRDAVFANGRLYWQASADGGFGQIAVWTTTNGADRTKVTGPDLRDPFGFPGSLVAIGGEVFFVGLDDATGTRGVFQINDDGITATRITPGGQFAAELAAAGGTLYFLGLDANGIEQLYSATPGTARRLRASRRPTVAWGISSSAAKGGCISAAAIHRRDASCGWWMRPRPRARGW